MPTRPGDAQCSSGQRSGEAATKPGRPLLVAPACRRGGSSCETQRTRPPAPGTPARLLPVVAGLAVYLLLSRSGSLYERGLLFTPTAMVIAQAVLTTPIAASLAHRALAPVLAEIGEALAVNAARLTLTPRS